MTWGFRGRVLIALSVFWLVAVGALLFVANRYASLHVDEMLEPAMRSEAAKLAASLASKPNEEVRQELQAYRSPLGAYVWLKEGQGVPEHFGSVPPEIVQADQNEVVEWLRRGGDFPFHLGPPARYGGAARIPGSPMIVGLSLPVGTLTGDLLMAGVALAVGGLIVLWMLATWISHPVRTLSRYAAAVVDGRNVGGPETTIPELAQMEEAVVALERARRHMTVLSSDLEAEVMPLTGLPGSGRLKQSLEEHIRSGSPFAVALIDLSHFATFNRRYGVQQGDNVLQTVVAMLRDELAKGSPDQHFLGHLRADHFAFLVPPGRVDAICESLIRRFDAESPFFYAEEDRKAGSITVKDRLGKSHTAPLMKMIVAVSTNTKRVILHPAQVENILQEIRVFLKNKGTSTYLVDRRIGGEESLYGGQESPPAAAATQA